MRTFKMFLLEGGAATAKWNTKRASKADIEDALEFVAKATGISLKTLRDNLLGSTGTTLKGKKESSGDIDIGLDDKKVDKDELIKAMMKATGDKGVWNEANRVGSFAVPTRTGNVQVDLMLLPDLDWAKFAYFSGEGDTSAYKSVVRNVLLVSVAQVRQEPGKDFIIHDKDGNIVARASRSFKLTTGLERLFKLAPLKKNGERSKGLAKVSPEELAKELKQLDPSVKFDKNADPITDPDKVAEFLFGEGVSADELMTAEDVLKLIKSNRFTAEERKHILDNAREHFKKTDIPVPPDIR